MNYREFYQKVGEEIGWDFSKLNCVSEGETWDFYETVASKLKKTDVWLDLASGSGEKFIAYAKKCLLLVASDFTESMIAKGKENIAKLKEKNVRFLKIDANKRIEFPEEFFDVISVRHGDFNPIEIKRLLKPNGLFLAQEVEFNDKENLHIYFGRHQMNNQKELLAKRYAKNFEKLGFSEVIIEEFDADEYYGGYKDLVFLLKNTPIVPNFGMEERDFDILDNFIKENTTEKGIKTNSHRSMIIARK